VAGTVSTLLAIGIAPWPGEGAQPAVTAALKSIGSPESKTKTATRGITQTKAISSQTNSGVGSVEPDPSDSHRQPPPSRDFLKPVETNLAVGGPRERSKADSTLPTALEDIVVQTFQIDEGPLQDVAQRLQQTLRDADPRKRDLRITVATQDLRIGLTMLESGPELAATLLDDVAKCCTIPVAWTLHGNEIVFDRITSGKWPLHLQRYQVGSAKLLAHIRGRLEKVGETPSDKNIQNEARAFFAEHGVVFPQQFDPASGTPDPASPKEVNVEQGERALFLSKDGDNLFVLASIPDHKRIYLALSVLVARAMPTTQALVVTNALDAVSTKAKPADLGLMELLLNPAFATFRRRPTPPAPWVAPWSFVDGW